MGHHLIVLHSAARVCPGYSRHEAPSILMEGASVAPGTEHGKAIAAQLTRRHGTLEEALDAGNFALAAAGIPPGIRRQAREACEDYFYRRLGLEPGFALARPYVPAASLEPLPDELHRALEDIAELVVDGEYEELRDLSGDRLEVEDLRRRLEDECPEALVLPPRDAYGVEAITRSEEPDEPGWTFFLELWTETGPARLHIEGILEEEADGRVVPTLADILP